MSLCRRGNRIYARATCKMYQNRLRARLSLNSQYFDMHALHIISWISYGLPTLVLQLLLLDYGLDASPGKHPDTQSGKGKTVQFIVVVQGFIHLSV